MFVISCYVEIVLAPNAMKDSCVSVADSKSREKVLRSQIEKSLQCKLLESLRFLILFGEAFYAPAEHHNRK